jgi:hypothetical protein
MQVTFALGSFKRGEIGDIGELGETPGLSAGLTGPLVPHAPGRTVEDRFCEDKT